MRLRSERSEFPGCSPTCGLRGMRQLVQAHASLSTTPAPWPLPGIVHRRLGVEAEEMRPLALQPA